MREIVGTFLFQEQEDGTPLQIGSGFIVQNEPEQVVICTAAHVLKDVANSLQPDFVNHLSIVPVDFQRPRPLLDLRRLHFVIEQDRTPVTLFITNCWWDDEQDLGFALAKYPPMASRPKAPYIVKLGDQLPKIGDVVGIFGFSKMQTMPKYENARYGTMARTPSLRFGRICDLENLGTNLLVAHETARQIRCTAPIESGMSGGLVAIAEPGIEMRAIGVACHAPSYQSIVDRSISAESTIVLISQYVKKIDDQRSELNLPFLFSGIGQTKN